MLGAELRRGWAQCAYIADWHSGQCVGLINQRSVDRNHGPLLGSAGRPQCSALWHSGPVASSSSGVHLPCSLEDDCGGFVAHHHMVRGEAIPLAFNLLLMVPDAVRIHSGLAQWLACWAHNPKVRGSKPRSATRALRPPTVAESWRSGTQASSSSKPAAECPCPVAPAQWLPLPQSSAGTRGLRAQWAAIVASVLG